MTVAKVKRKTRTGEVREFLQIDALLEYPDGRKERVRKVAPIQNEREALRYERELRKAASLGTRIKPSDRKAAECPRFVEFAKEFLSNYALTNNKDSEYEAKESILRVHLIPAFGRKRLDEISTLDVDAYKATKRLEKLAPKTVNNHLTVLGRALRVAMEWGKLKSLPRIRWFKVPRPEFDFLTLEEAPRLLAGADIGRWHLMILLALRAGLRQGEMLALRWQDVDLANGRVMVRRRVYKGKFTVPKGGRTREVPLGADLAAALTAMTGASDLIFPGVNGKTLTKGQCRWPLWRACHAAGLRRIGWHVLRHTFASHLAMKGVPLKAIQDLLGHTTMDMTLRYAHLSPHVGRDAVRMLDSPVAQRERPVTSVPVAPSGAAGADVPAEAGHANLMPTQSEIPEKCLVSR